MDGCFTGLDDESTRRRSSLRLHLLINTEASPSPHAEKPAPVQSNIKCQYIVSHVLVPINQGPIQGPRSFTPSPAILSSPSWPAINPLTTADGILSPSDGMGSLGRPRSVHNKGPRRVASHSLCHGCRFDVSFFGGVRSTQEAHSQCRSLGVCMYIYIYMLMGNPRNNKSICQGTPLTPCQSQLMFW